MTPATLQTKRLTMRCPTTADSDGLVAVLNDERIAQWLARVPHPYTREDAVRWIAIAADNWRRDTAYPFSAFEGDTLIGGIGITRVSDTDGVLGYWLSPAKWRQGYGREMMQAVLAFGFATCGFTRFTAGIHPDNERSGGLLTACGFTPIGDQVYLHPPRNYALKGPHFQLTFDEYRTAHVKDQPHEPE